MDTDIEFHEKNERLYFIADMHDYQILSEPKTGRPILFTTPRSAETESKRLNALGIEGLTIRKVGIPWRIYPLPGRKVNPPSRIFGHTFTIAAEVT